MPTTKKPRKSSNRAPAAPSNDTDSTALPANFIEAVKGAHYAQEDHALEQVAMMARMDPNGFAAGLLAHFVAKAACHVLLLEHDSNGEVTPDVVRAREQFTKALMKGCEVLGSKFDALYTAKIAEHNAGARMTLDQSNGTTRSITAYVIPAFEADGTHAPIGPKDFPWAQEV